jgi:hypothetical protein
MKPINLIYMKKLTTTLAIFFIASIAYSQCTPFLFYGPGFLYPDSTQGISAVNPLNYYYQEVTTYVPPQATINGLVVPIDSAKFVAATGLPSGLSVWPNISPDRAWASGTNGCFVIHGQTMFIDSGMYAPTLSFLVFGLGTSTLLHFGYSMEVLGASVAGISSLNNDNKKIFAYYDGGNIVINSEVAETAVIGIYDMQGKLLIEESRSFENGITRILSNGLAKQMVFVRIVAESISYTQKVLIF